MLTVWPTGSIPSPKRLAAVVLPSATETDALSTALLVRGISGHQEIFQLRPGMKTLVISGPNALQTEALGIELNAGLEQEAR